MIPIEVHFKHIPMDSDDPKAHNFQNTIDGIHNGPLFWDGEQSLVGRAQGVPVEGGLLTAFHVIHEREKPRILVAGKEVEVAFVSGKFALLSCSEGRPIEIAEHVAIGPAVHMYYDHSSGKVEANLVEILTPTGINHCFEHGQSGSGIYQAGKLVGIATKTDGGFWNCDQIQLFLQGWDDGPDFDPVEIG